MAATRKQGKGTPDRGSAAPAADSGTAQVPGEQIERRDRTEPEPDQAAPTVGKTGAGGARAERPSEGGSDRRRGKTPPAESSRTHKPPAETPKARGLTGPSASAK